MSASQEKYADAIADLQTQRSAVEAQLATIDTAIAALKALQDGSPIMAMNTPQLSANHGGSTPPGSGMQIEVDTFHNLTTAQSIRKYLAMRNRKPASTQEIVEALQTGGQSGADGANFAVVVNNSLNRMAAADGEVSKVKKGIWGLKSWYTAKVE
jgi:hypothetical protein